MQVCASKVREQPALLGAIFRNLSNATGERILIVSGRGQVSLAGIALFDSRTPFRYRSLGDDRGPKMEPRGGRAQTLVAEPPNLRQTGGRPAHTLV
jgi:hypothetical protein